MKGNLIAAMLVAGAIALSGCTTVSPVTPAGKDTYLLGARQMGGASWEKVKAAAYQQASDYCAKQGEQMDEVDMQTHGARGWTPQDVDLKFRCVKS